MDDIIDGVKTPKVDDPDYSDPAQFMKAFEERNQNLGLFYTLGTMEGFNELIEDIDGIWQRQEKEPLSNIFTWNLHVEELEDLIEKVKNPYTQKTLTNKYVQLVYEAKKIPTDRAHCYIVFKEMLQELCDKCVDVDTKFRDEAIMMPRGDFEPLADDLTAEEIEELNRTNGLKRLGNVKKGKKPQTEEEKAAELEEHKLKVADCLSKNLVATRIDRSEHQI